MFLSDWLKAGPGLGFCLVKMCLFSTLSEVSMMYSLGVSGSKVVSKLACQLVMFHFAVIILAFDFLLPLPSNTANIFTDIPLNPHRNGFSRVPYEVHLYSVS